MAMRYRFFAVFSCRLWESCSEEKSYFETGRKAGLFFVNKKMHIVKRKKRNFKSYMEYILIRKSFVSYVILREAEIFL